MITLIQKLRSFGRSSPSAAFDVAVPFWQERPPGASAPARSLRVLWTGSQVAPVPVIVRDPPAFDPTR